MGDMLIHIRFHSYMIAFFQLYGSIRLRTVLAVPGLSAKPTKIVLETS